MSNGTLFHRRSFAMRCMQNRKLKKQKTFTRQIGKTTVKHTDWMSVCDVCVCLFIWRPPTSKCCSTWHPYCAMCCSPLIQQTSNLQPNTGVPLVMCFGYSFRVHVFRVLHCESVCACVLSISFWLMRPSRCRFHSHSIHRLHRRKYTSLKCVYFACCCYFLLYFFCYSVGFGRIFFFPLSINLTKLWIDEKKLEAFIAHTMCVHAYVCMANRNILYKH